MRSVTISAIITTGVLLILSLIRNGLPSGSVHEPELSTLLALVLATLVTLYPLIRNFALGEDPLEPSVILGGLLFMYFPLPAFGIAVLDFTPTFPSFISNVDSLLSAFTWSLVVISVGAGALYLGYRIFHLWETKPLWPKLGERRLFIGNTFAIWVCSVSVHVVQKLSMIGRGNALFYYLTQWQYLAVLVLFASYFHSKGRLSSSRLLFLVLAVEFCIVTVLGFNLNLLLTLVTFLTLVYHYLGPGITYRKLAALGTFIVILFPVSEIAESIQSGQTIVQAFETSKGLLWYVNAFVGRMIGTDALTMIIARTPEQVPYQGGKTLLLAIYGLVPRILWSSKPSLIMCSVNNRYFSGRGVDAGTCAAMTTPGELYWNFGILGVVIGLFCMGLLLGGLYRRFTRIEGKTRGYILLVVYAIVLLQLMRFERGVGQIVNNIVKQLGFAFVLLWLTTEPISSKTVLLNDNSVFEQSYFYRLGEALWNSRSTSFVASLPAVAQVRRSILVIPRIISISIETSWVYATTVRVDYLLSEWWNESKIQNCTHLVNRLRMVVRHSKTYRYFS